MLRASLNVLQKILRLKKLTLSSPFSMSSLCPLYLRCQEVFKTLNIPAENLEKKRDTCFSRCCYKEGKIYYRGHQIYEIPMGSCRFGIKIKPEYDEKEVSHNWVNSYHGTSHKNVPNIIQFGLQKPGTKLPNGEPINIREGHIPKENFIFSSASFVCACGGYAIKYQEPNSRKNYKLLLQLRLKPKSFKVQKDTFNKKLIDQYVKDLLYEYISEKTENIAIIGVCIFEIDSSNMSLPKELTVENYDFSIPRHDMQKMRDAVQRLLKETPTIYEKIDFAKKNIPKMLKFQGLIKNIINIKEIKNKTKMASGSTSIIGAALSFTTMAQISVPVGILSMIVGARTEWKACKDKKALKEEISNIDLIMKNAKELNEIIQKFYTQRNLDFMEIGNQDKNLIEEINVMQPIMELASDACLGLVLSQSQNSVQLTTEISKLSVQHASSIKEMTLLTPKIEIAKQAIGSFEEDIKFGRNILKTCENLLPKEISDSLWKYGRSYKSTLEKGLEISKATLNQASQITQTTEKLGQEIAAKSTAKAVTIQSVSWWGKVGTTVGAIGIIFDVYDIWKNGKELMSKGELEKAYEIMTEKYSIYKRSGQHLEAWVYSFEAQVKEFEEILNRFKE